MDKVIENIQNIFKIQDLRNRIFFTLGILFLYRLGCMVLVPGIDSKEVAHLFDLAGSNMLDMANTFSGGALANAAVFALGIMPYITASIILQILQKSVPYLERLSKEGEQGRNKINRYTRYLTVVFALLHSWGITQLLISMDQGNGSMITLESTLYFRIVAMVTLTTGAILIMWLGEKITENGIGNGISLIIFASIVVVVPGSVGQIWTQVQSGAIPAPIMALVLAVVAATIVFVVFFELGTRKITIQYAKRMGKEGQGGGGSSHLPFKVNSANVIPVIFSASVIQIPSMLLNVTSESKNAVLYGVLDQLSYGRPLSNVLFFVTTMFFTFFYVEMLFNPKDTAENLKKQGGFIPGIRPGIETQEYIERVLNRLTFWGGLYLSLVSIVPSLIMTGLQLNRLPSWLGGDLFAEYLPAMLNDGTGVMLASALGGTSLLIIISVALDFINKIDNQLVMRKYDGFTSSAGGSKIRTRRYA